MTNLHPILRGIDHDSLEPYYAQVLFRLRKGINEGVWKSGEILPSETELCDALGVSRTVVRRALQEMEYEGLIYKRQGKGSFVAERKLQERLIQRLTGFHQDMIEQGHSIANRILRQEIAPFDGEAAAALDVERGGEAVLLERVRMVDDLPVNLSISYVPRTRCPALLTADLTKGSLYAFIEQSCGQRIMRGRRTIEAMRPTAHLAHVLEIEQDLPVFKITNTCYLADGTPIEHSRGYHRSDRTLFQVELLRTEVDDSSLSYARREALPQSHTLLDS